MTQDGETENYTAADHVRALLDHGGHNLFQFALVNDRPLPADALNPYLRENASPVTVDDEALRALGVTPVYASVSDWKGGLIRHDSAALANALMTLYYEQAATRTAD